MRMRVPSDEACTIRPKADEAGWPLAKLCCSYMTRPPAAGGQAALRLPVQTLSIPYRADLQASMAESSGLSELEPASSTCKPICLAKSPMRACLTTYLSFSCSTRAFSSPLCNVYQAKGRWLAEYSHH